jgi:hypothetical protein
MAIPSSRLPHYARNGEVRIAFEDLGGAGATPLADHGPGGVKVLVAAGSGR